MQVFLERGFFTFYCYQLQDDRLKLARRQIDKETNFPINSNILAEYEYEVGRKPEKASFPKHGPYILYLIPYTYILYVIYVKYQVVSKQANKDQSIQFVVRRNYKQLQYALVCLHVALSRYLAI